MRNLKGEYVCGRCGGKFVDLWPKEEAVKELSRVFPGTGVEDAIPVCDDCYVELMKNAGKPIPRNN